MSYQNFFPLPEPASPNERALLKMICELEAERDLFVRAIGRVRAGLPLEPAAAKASALTVDALEALARIAAEHHEMTEALDAFNAALGKAATRASEGRMVAQSIAGGFLLPKASP